MTIYCVGGFMRCGTSAMMGALEAGGMPAIYNTEPGYQGTNPDYHPNPKGYYEQQFDANSPEFIDKFDGKLIKMLRTVCQHLPVHRYEAVIMWRRPEEVVRSLMLMGQPEQDPEEFAEFQRVISDHWNNRKDTRTVLVRHQDLLKRPVDTFEYINQELGWSVNVEAAAATIDTSLWRAKV